MTTQVVSLTCQKAKHTTSLSSEPEPTNEVEEPNTDKGRVRSINRVFSRMTSTPSVVSAPPTQISFDKNAGGHSTPRARSISRVISKVFSIASEDGIVRTSTRKVERKNLTKVIRVLITPTGKIDEPQEDDAASNDLSTLPTILSHEDGNEGDVVHEAQLQKDALLLAYAKQTVQSTLANDENRNATMLGSLINSNAKETHGSGKESDKEGVETSMLNRISGAFGACSMRLCFERDEPAKNREGQQITISQGYGDLPNFVEDDMSSLSGMSSFY